MTALNVLREERQLMPRTTVGVDAPPERACTIMADELDALARDIVAAREQARRMRAAGLQLGSRRPRPALEGERVHLRSGAEVVIRPVVREDARLLARHFEGLGALTRYRRFLVSLERLTPHQIAFLTSVDHVGHEALVALDAQTGEGVGVVRYLRDPVERRRTQVAAAVIDRWQGYGLGTLLLERLSARARANGIETLTASTVAGNAAARGMMARAGGPLADEASAGTLQLTARLG